MTDADVEPAAHAILADDWGDRRAWFEFVALPGRVVATLLAITAAYAGASELAKRRFGLP